MTVSLQIYGIAMRGQRSAPAPASTIIYVARSLVEMMAWSREAPVDKDETSSPRHGEPAPDSGGPRKAGSR